jgi:3-deoxy-D-manno-octulosonic-acid transferase
LIAWTWTPLLPLWAAVIALHPRLRRDAAERLGWTVLPVAPGVTWVHAASVGEIGAAEALLPHLPGPILLTADTDTGAERARAIASASGGRVVAGVRPVDHPWTIAPLWAEARPKALIFVEGTYWPALAARARSAGVPILRVSAKARRGRWLQSLFHATMVVARDEAEAAFFRPFGDVVVGGDLKGDRPVPPSPLRWSRPFVVGASTRPGEEEALLEAMTKVRARVPGAPALLLAPRHRERFDGVARTLEGLGVRWARRSELAEGLVPAGADVVLLDSVGELAGCLQGAQAAFVGGTFDPGVGGHSPAEAGAAGVPVVSGPEIAGNAEAFRAVGAVKVDRPEQLADALIEACLAPRPTPWSNGAAVRTAAAIARWLGGPAAPEASPRPWLLPIALVWAGVIGLRNGLWDRRRPAALPVPVVAVGSTNARGPGKTSTARWFARALRDRGHVVGVATRGYGRARRGSDVRLSTATQDAADLGDEGALFAAEGFLVAAGPDRVACGRMLAAAGATVVVLDDGLQHRRLRRDVDVVVVDARFPNARGPIPAGERREWASVPPRATLVIVHHADEPGAVAVDGLRARRVPGPWRRGEARVTRPEGPVALVCGVARPGDVLRGLGLPVARFRVLPDHAPVGDALAAELSAWAGDLPIVTTAKDRVRLPEPLRSSVLWRDVELEIDGVPEDLFPKVNR